MKLGVLVGYSGRQIELPLDMIREAESMGYDTAWTAEAYGSDAVTPAAWILANTTTIKVGTAIMQMPARSPAMAAMTAMTLAQLSGDRFIIGLGASGPQVVEGWHGVAYGKPITRTREYIEIIRKIMARQGPVTFEGKQYTLPYKGSDGTGLGKPLKSIMSATDIPIYTASITPTGIQTAAELADGTFPVWMVPERYDVFADSIEAGFAKAGGGKSLNDFCIAPFVSAVMGDDVEQCRLPVKGMMALYIGGMGAKSKNFYTDYANALGFGEAAAKIQDLYLAGKKTEAMAAVPDDLVDAAALVGPKERIVERLQAWKKAGTLGHVGAMLIGTGDVATLKVIADEML